jgi:hypothetical protein
MLMQCYKPEGNVDAMLGTSLMGPSGVNSSEIAIVCRGHKKLKD